MSDENISKAIYERCKYGITLLIILDVFTILFFFVTLTINIVAVIVTGLLVACITFLIIFFKKIQKEPLKYRKYFFNLNSEVMTIKKREEMEKSQLQKEVNFSSNKTLLVELGKFAIADLIKYNRIENDSNIEVEFGYVYQDCFGKINALYKVKKDDKLFYYVCEKNSAYGVNITEEMYQDRLKNTFMTHKCLQTLEGADTKERNVTYEVHEENLINDRASKEFVANLAVKYLIHNNKIVNSNNINIEFGYIYLNKNGTRCSLFKVIKDSNIFYFSLKNEFELTLIDFNEEQFNKEVEQAKIEHACLNDSTLKENESERIRREMNNNIVKSRGIIYNDLLLCNSEDRNFKDIDELCKRAIACLLTIQVACDINNKKNIDYSIDVIGRLLDKFDVRECLNSKEKRIMSKTYTEQDAIDMDWEYESYWALCWVLGLVDDISDGGILCNCDSAMSFVLSTSSVEEFKSRCKLRSKSEILDMEDLYFRYEWAINECKINPNASMGNLNASVVHERYRGLRWVLSDVDDWYDLSLNA